MHHLASIINANTVQCHYNMVIFSKILTINTIDCPWGCGLLWVQPLIHVLPQSLPYHMQYHVILDCIIMPFDSISKGWPLISISCIFLQCWVCTSAFPVIYGLKTKMMIDVLFDYKPMYLNIREGIINLYGRGICQGWFITNTPAIIYDLS